MAYQYADQANKVLLSAIPTVDEAGNVKKWDVVAQYSLDGYKSKYTAELYAGEFATAKPPSGFTQSEIWDACPHAQWDMVYDSQYHSVMVVVPDTKMGDFDVSSLPPGDTLPASTRKKVT